VGRQAAVSGPVLCLAMLGLLTRPDGSVGPPSALIRPDGAGSALSAGVCVQPLPAGACVLPVKRPLGTLFLWGQNICAPLFGLWVFGGLRPGGFCESAALVRQT